MRAAMIGGAGYAAGKRMQQGAVRESDQETRIENLERSQAPPPPPPQSPADPLGAGSPDMVGKLTELASLKSQGALTDEEFQAAKAKLLGQ